MATISTDNSTLQKRIGKVQKRKMMNYNSKINEIVDILMEISDNAKKNGIDVRDDIMEIDDALTQLKYKLKGQ